MRILVVDLGGSHVKILASGQKESRRAPSGKRLTPARMVEIVKRLARGWKYDAVSLGFPGPVGRDGPSEQPVNLGKGWVGFDFAGAFGCPVKVLNDAAMQALGSYDGGRMLFLGLGTGLGSTLVSAKVLVPLELGQLPYKNKGTLADWLGKEGLNHIGREAWQRALEEAVAVLKGAFAADYIVLGGGNAAKVKPVPQGCRLGHNDN